MMMQAWVMADSQGREYLVRSGRGCVTALVPDGTSSQMALRAEIECELPPGRSRSIRYTTVGLMDADDPLLPVAAAAEISGELVQWTIEWHRHSEVPDHLPISVLNLVLDTRGSVTGLSFVDTDESISMISRGANEQD